MFYTTLTMSNKAHFLMIMFYKTNWNGGTYLVFGMMYNIFTIILSSSVDKNYKQVKCMPLKWNIIKDHLDDKLDKVKTSLFSINGRNFLEKMPGSRVNLTSSIRILQSSSPVILTIFGGTVLQEWHYWTSTATFMWKI